MDSGMTLAAVEFDPFSNEFFEDPTEVYSRLREEAPVYFSQKYGFYALSRYADVLAAHRDWQGFSSEHGIDLSSLSKDHAFIKSLGMMIMMDPPEHNRFRNLVGRVFSPRAVAELEPMICEVIIGLLDDLSNRDNFDVVADFSGPFPVEVISRMLGVPTGERQQIRHWLDLMLHREPGEMDPTPDGQVAALELVGYFHDLSIEKRNHPGDDMLTRLSQVTIDRGDGVETMLSDNEIAGFAGLLAGAGAETVTKLIGNAVVLFNDHPDQWRTIQANTKRIPEAVEEILRILPPSQYQGRYSMEERKLEGGTIPAGFPVLLLTGAATRDPRAFEEPNKFNIDRPRSLGVAFGQGVHICLGASLARMESRIALEELAARWDRLEVDKTGLKRVTMSNVAGYSNVPVAAVR
jgi:cytochrome P450